MRHRFPEHVHQELEKLTRALVRKLLHHPSRHLRHGSSFEPEKLGLVRDLFRLDDETE